MSNSATSAFLARIGTTMFAFTISDPERYRGSLATSFTTTVWRVVAAAPHSPLQSFIDGDAHVRAETTDVWSHHQHSRIARVDQIKTNPVIARHLIVQAL